MAELRLSGADFRASRAWVLDIFRVGGLTKGSIMLFSPHAPKEAYSGSPMALSQEALFF
jgi:hypothetical protein